MLRARIRVMKRMKPSHLKDQIIEELTAQVEAEGSMEDRAILYEGLFEIHQERMDFAWFKVMEAVSAKIKFLGNKQGKALAVYEKWTKQGLVLLRKWTEAARGESRLRAWGQLLACLDVKEDREEMAELWCLAKKALLDLEEEDRQATIRTWMDMLSLGTWEDEAWDALLSRRRKNEVRLMRFYPLESLMDVKNREHFYRAMLLAHLYQDQEMAAAEWALKGMYRLEEMMESDALFLYLEWVNGKLGLAWQGEMENLALVRRQWELATDLGAYGSQAKLSLVLIHCALNENRDKEALSQWQHLEGAIQHYGKSILFGSWEKKASRLMGKLKKRLIKVEKIS